MTRYVDVCAGKRIFSLFVTTYHFLVGPKAYATHPQPMSSSSTWPPLRMQSSGVTRFPSQIRAFYGLLYAVEFFV
jgi:hypothetical protein